MNNKSITGKLPIGIFNPIKPSNNINKIVIEALEHMDNIFQLEKSTGDFPEQEWIEAKTLVYKALSQLKSEGETIKNPCVSCECVKCLSHCGDRICRNCINYDFIHTCDMC